MGTVSPERDPNSGSIALTCCVRISGSCPDGGFPCGGQCCSGANGCCQGGDPAYCGSCFTDLAKKYKQIFFGHMSMRTCTSRSSSRSSSRPSRSLPRSEVKFVKKIE